MEDTQAQVEALQQARLESLGRLDALEDQAVEKLRAERDAYRRAKQENDERFQLAAAEQRERAEKAEAKLKALLTLADDKQRMFGLGMDNADELMLITPSDIREIVEDD